MSVGPQLGSIVLFGGNGVANKWKIPYEKKKVITTTGNAKNTHFFWNRFSIFLRKEVALVSGLFCGEKCWFWSMFFALKIQDDEISQKKKFKITQVPLYYKAKIKFALEKPNF